jgi:hypothetical protein
MRHGRKIAGPNDECWNCHEKGHYSQDCPDDQKERCTANAIMDSESDRCFAAHEAGDQRIKDVKEKNDWFTGAADNHDSLWKQYYSALEYDTNSKLRAQVNSGAEVKAAATVMNIGQPNENSPKMELFNSGATRHISPY